MVKGAVKFPVIQVNLRYNPGVRFSVQILENVKHLIFWRIQWQIY